MYSKLKELDIPVELYAPFGTPSGHLSEDFLGAGQMEFPVKDRQREKLRPEWAALVEVFYELERQQYTYPVSPTSSSFPVANCCGWCLPARTSPRTYQWIDTEIGAYSACKPCKVRGRSAIHYGDMAIAGQRVRVSFIATERRQQVFQPPLNDLGDYRVVGIEQVQESELERAWSANYCA